MPYGFSYCGETVARRVTLRSDSASADAELVFEPYQSLLLRLAANGDVEFIDAAYRPWDPVSG
jgi:hypothetical protein